MHWVVVSSRCAPEHGGAGTGVDAFLRAAVDAGWRIDLITRAGRDAHRGVEVHQIPTVDDDAAFSKRMPMLRAIDRIRPYRYGLWSLAVAEYLQHADLKPDVIEFADVQAEGLVALTDDLVRQRYADVPMIIHAHAPMFVAETRSGFPPERFGREIYHEWERRALLAADGVLAPSSRILNAIEHGGASLLVPYIVNAAEIRPAAPAGESILLIGPAEPNKGVAVWAQSLNQVLARYPGITARHIGSDTPTGPNDGSMVEHMCDQIEPGLRDRFTSLGSCAHEQVTDEVRRAALVVVPSRFESFSHVAAEAIVRGVPVVVSDQVGVLEIAAELPVVPGDDVDALAEAQCRVLEDSDAARDRVLAAREQLLRSCDPGRNLERRRAFVEVLQRGHRAANTQVSDGVGAMRRFLAEVEEQELDHALACERPMRTAV